MEVLNVSLLLLSLLPATPVDTDTEAGDDNVANTPFFAKPRSPPDATLARPAKVAVVAVDVVLLALGGAAATTEYCLYNNKFFLFFLFLLLHTISCAGITWVVVAVVAVTGTASTVVSSNRFVMAVVVVTLARLG